MNSHPLEPELAAMGVTVPGALQYAIRAALTTDSDCGLRAAIGKGQYRLGSPVVPLQAVELASEIATDFEVMIALCIRRVRRFTRPVVIQIATGGLAVACVINPKLYLTVVIASRDLMPAARENRLTGHTGGSCFSADLISETHVLVGELLCALPQVNKTAAGFTERKDFYRKAKAGGYIQPREAIAPQLTGTL